MNACGVRRLESTSALLAQCGFRRFSTRRIRATRLDASTRDSTTLRADAVIVTGGRLFRTVLGAVPSRRGVVVVDSTSANIVTSDLGRNLERSAEHVTTDSTKAEYSHSNSSPRWHADHRLDESDVCDTRGWADRDANCARENQPSTVAKLGAMLEECLRIGVVVAQPRQLLSRLSPVRHSQSRS